MSSGHPRRSLGVRPSSANEERSDLAVLKSPDFKNDSPARQIRMEAYCDVHEAEFRFMYQSRGVAMSRTRIALIAAVDRHRVIGRNNQLPWRLPNDLKRFKELTLGHPVLMGRKTWESIGRPLPGRRNLVLSRDPAFRAEGAEVVHSPEEALQALSSSPMLFVIGGETLYRHFLPLATDLFLTHVHTDVEGGDAFFPPIPGGMFSEICRMPHSADARHPFAYDFVDYEKTR
jgi:dihydrofolate reductase